MLSERHTLASKQSARTPFHSACEFETGTVRNVARGIRQQIPPGTPMRVELSHSGGGGGGGGGVASLDGFPQQDNTRAGALHAHVLSHNPN